MGACASFPKFLGGKAPAPEPEQPKEETPEAVAEKGVEEVKAEEEPKEEAKRAEEQKEKSVSSLLEATEEVKKEKDEVAGPAVVVEVKDIHATLVEEKIVKPAATTEELKKE